VANKNREENPKQRQRNNEEGDVKRRLTRLGASYAVSILKESSPRLSLSASRRVLISLLVSSRAFLIVQENLGKFPSRRRDLRSLSVTCPEGSIATFPLAFLRLSSASFETEISTANEQNLIRCSSSALPFDYIELNRTGTTSLIPGVLLENNRSIEHSSRPAASWRADFRYDFKVIAADGSGSLHRSSF